jgi:hypothetical protein
MPRTQPRLSGWQNWKAPDEAHPAAIFLREELADWVSRAYEGVDRQKVVGKVFLYNISLETFGPDAFRGVWLSNYATSTQNHLSSCVDSIHLMIPFHRAQRSNKRERLKQRRIAEWLDCAYLREMLERLPDEARDLEDAKIVLQKTWVSLVEVPSPDEVNSIAKATEGEYAFGLYFAVPRTGEDVDRLLQKVSFDGLGSADARQAVNDLSKFVRLLLGCGIDEPFSRRESGYFKYYLLLAISPRECRQARSVAACPLQEHIKVLAKLWRDRKSPLDLYPCTLLQRNRACAADRELRLDGFLAWARGVLTSQEVRREPQHRIWVIPPGARSLEIKRKIRTAGQDEETDEFRFLKVFPEWELEFGRDDKVYRLLRRRQVYRLQEHALIEGQNYYRRREVIERLRRSFLEPLRTVVLRMRRGEELQPAQLPPVFFLYGPAGGGKTELLKATGEFLKGRSRDARDKRLEHLADYEILNVAQLSLRTLQRKVNDIKRRLKKERRPYILGFDEVHKVEDLKAFADTIYTDFDLYDNEAVPIAFVLMTSYGGGRQYAFTEKIETLGGPADFISRLESHMIGVPTNTAVDDLLRILSVAKSEVQEGEFSVEKRALAYLLIERPWRTPRGVNQLAPDLSIWRKNPKTILRLERFIPSDRRWRLMYESFLRSDVAVQLGDATLRIVL